MRALLEHLKIQSATLIGPSLGAATAINFALTPEITGARQGVFRGAGQLVPMEKPGEFNALAREFLAGFERKAK